MILIITMHVYAYSKQSGAALYILVDTFWDMGPTGTH